MSVIGEFDGFPVNKIEGGRVPVFLLDDVVSQLNGVTLVEEVGFQFRGVGVSVNENIRRCAGEYGGSCWRGAVLTGVCDGTGNVAHTVDSYWRGQFHEIGDVFLLVRLNMVALDGNGKRGFYSLDFSDDIAVSAHNMFDGEGWSMVKAIENSGVVHVMMYGGCGRRMTIVLEIG